MDDLNLASLMAMAASMPSIDLMTTLPFPRAFSSMSSSRISLRNCSRTVTDCVTTAILTISLPEPTPSLSMAILMNAPSMLCVASSRMSGRLPLPWPIGGQICTSIYSHRAP